MTAEGMTGREIGRELGISYMNVSRHLSKIRKILGVRTVPQAVAVAISKRII